MKRTLIVFVSLLLILPLIFAKKVSAASLEITALGTMDVSDLNLGSSLKSYTYSGGTFELTGLASPSAIISVTVDDTTQTATADEEGGWSTLISSLAEGQHQFDLSSEGESLDFVLTVGLNATEEAETESATTSSETLPEAGSTLTSMIFLAFAMLSVGLGLTIKAKQS
jgi:hypothetical protein